MEPTDEISNLINCLSNNEDIRQDLWVRYLSGTPVELLASCLKQVQVKHSDDIKLRKAVWQLVQQPISEELSTFLLNNFTDYERSIICFLTLGIEIKKISMIKGISKVRIKQTIATIRYNRCWSKINGTKEKPDRRRKIRS